MSHDNLDAATIARPGAAGRRRARSKGDGWRSSELGFCSPMGACLTKSMQESILTRFGQHTIFHVKAHGGELARLCAMGSDENRFTR